MPKQTKPLRMIRVRHRVMFCLCSIEIAFLSLSGLHMTSVNTFSTLYLSKSTYGMWGSDSKVPFKRQSHNH